VLETFAKLALERGTAYSVAEELASRDLPVPDLELGRVVSDDGTPARLDAHGDLLGIWPQIRLEQVELRLAPGESLILYTDGVTDQGPGAERSPEHALRELAADPSAGALADALRAEAERSSSVLRDDVAILALRYLPPSAGRSTPARTERHGVVRAGEPA
jgi:Stage II sporulation protein E (SpoIIE)